MGAVAFTKDFQQPRRISRHMHEQTGTVTMSASYATGGDTDFDPANAPSANYVSVAIEPKGGRIFEFDKTNKKVLAYEDGATVGGALDEVPSATNLSAVVTRYRAVVKV